MTYQRQILMLASSEAAALKDLVDLLEISVID